MKKVLFTAVSLCTAAVAASAPAVAASAAEGPYYPDIYDAPLTFEALSDYAVGEGNSFAFADGKEILYLKNEDLTRYSFDSDISALDYSDGVFYYSLKGDERVYSLPGNQLSNYVMPDFSKDIIVDNLQYFYNAANGALTLLYRDGTSGESTVVLEGCTRIKKYNGTLYVIEDNSLMELEGESRTAVEIVYSNYDLLTKIPAGDIPQKLGEYETYGQAVKTVNIAEGATATKIDLNEPLSGVFGVSDPRKSTVTFPSGGQALLLAEAGSLRVIADGQNCYIIDAGQATDLAELPLTPVKQGTTATVNADEYCYALPYLCNATRSERLAPAEVVEVLYSAKASDAPVLAHDFYIIKNSKGEYGYVAAEFISDLNYPPIDEDGASNIADPSPDYSDNVRTVVLVLVVVALVLIAVGYITFVVTGKHRKVKKNADGQVDVTKEQEREERDKQE